MRIAITADLHFGHKRLGDDATRLLHEHLQREPVDLLLLGGDIGTDQHFAECLGLFRELPCAKAVVPGNHDVWIADNDHRGDSLDVYQTYLPNLCAQLGYHYLDRGPLLYPNANLAIVGSMNWYDYSWAIERMKEEVPNWEWHLKNKAFTRGRHNDGRFVRWPTDDVGFTRMIVDAFDKQLTHALNQVEHALVITHHPAFHGISFPYTAPATGLDQLLWQALSGNRRIEAILAQNADRIPFIFSGHTHRANQATLGTARGFNIGGDYHFKRMLLLDWRTREMQTFVFGDPERRK